MVTAPMCLESMGQPTHIDEVWVADTTYLRTLAGWMYLATVMDLFSRRLLGWSVSNHNDAKLVGKALKAAAMTRGTLRTGIIHHSDRGSPYASDDYQRLVSELGMKPSMSAQGNCYDNAAMESFYGRFKTSTIRGRHFADERELRSTVFEYVNLLQPISQTFLSELPKPSPIRGKYLPPMGGNEKNKTLYQNKPPDTLINKQ